MAAAHLIETGQNTCQDIETNKSILNIMMKMCSVFKYLRKKEKKINSCGTCQSFMDG